MESIPLIIAGPHEKQIEYYNKKVKPNLCDQIQFVGKIEWDSPVKHGLLSNALCLLYPSKCREAQGIAQKEALIMGTPIVTSDLGGLPESTNGIPYAYSCSNVDEMIKAVLLINEDKPDKIMKQKMRDLIIEQTNPVRQVGKIIELYKRVIGGETW